MGLLSSGGIHSHIDHLKAICDIAISQNINDIFIHAFTDGRDTDPKSGLNYIKELLDYIKNKNITIASVIGRYYSMDRDKRWERTSLAYNMLVHGEGIKTQNIIESIQDSYNQDKTDEFILPIVNVDNNNKPITTIQSGDTVICFNFRSDRCRQLVAALTQIDIPQYNIKSLDIDLYTMTKYDDSFDEIKVFYPKKHIANTIGHVIEKEKLTQLRIAETEKYPHVTFFFSGGQESEMKGETRIMIPSAKVPTYNLKPEMSADKITKAYIEAIKTQKPSFVCLNYANPDMVGHTGHYDSVKKAIETIDICLKELIEASIKEDYALVIIADHGNAEKMKNKDGSPNTAHTTNKVPCFILNANIEHIKPGSLCDIAPTILKIMNIEKPNEMTGSSIIS
jgi:2,3-bisphosphoglycerate-independent phosphoglycerate mutase